MSDVHLMADDQSAQIAEALHLLVDGYSVVVLVRDANNRFKMLANLTTPGDALAMVQAAAQDPVLAGPTRSVDAITSAPGV